MASLVAPKDKVFITQTKLLYEVTWKTVMQIAKKHAVSTSEIFIFHDFVLEKGIGSVDLIIRLLS